MDGKPRTQMPPGDIGAADRMTAADASAPRGGSCGCCAPQQTTSVSATTKDAVTAEYSVTGLTCGSCAGRVSRALSVLDEVQDVRIALVPGGISTVSVISSQSLARASVQDVVEKAGYHLTTA